MGTDGPFWVTFFFKGTPTTVATPDHEPWNLESIQEGFWLTQDRAMCRASQGHFWIPPSMVMLVEKRE